jgi:hypothetical protein
MELLHHAPLSHDRTQNSSKFVVPLVFRATYTTIEIHEHVLIGLHNHLTKSNVDPYVCSSL